MDKPHNHSEQAAFQAEFERQALQGGESRPTETGWDYLGPEMQAEFTRYVGERRQTEIRWLEDLRQFKGVYPPETMQAIGKRSKVFVKRTQTKVRTATARMLDLLFPAGGDRNYTVDPTPKPTLPKSELRSVVQLIAQAKGAMPERDEVKAAVLDIAKRRSAAMMLTIDDQLAETHYKRECKQVIKDGNLYGTGILKGPLVERRVRVRYVFDEPSRRWTQKQEVYAVPFLAHTPIWNFYPDMSVTDIDDCWSVWERHMMTRPGLFELTKRKSFDGRAIRDYIQSNPRGMIQAQDIDTQLRLLGDRQNTRTVDNGLYEVLERWGWLTGEQLFGAGVEVPEGRRDENFFCNVWMLPNAKVIKLSIEPIQGMGYPYHLYYLERDETSIWGEGYSKLLRDDQEMLNAAVRMLLDNMAQSGGPLIERNVGLMDATQKADRDIHPWKTIDRTREHPEQPAIRIHEIPSHAPEINAIVQLFEQYMDEDSALPRYMSGENATQGAAGTAQGLSMLMSASSIVLKDAVVNFDEGVTRPFITGLYRWNMQYNQNPEIKGDYDVKARGASALMAREVRGQQLLAFGAQVPPEARNAVKWRNFVEELASTMEAAGLVMNEEEWTKMQQDPAVQAQQQLAMKTAEATLAKLTAEVQKVLAQVEQLKAQALETKVGAAYSAMQAGGVAASSPAVAAAGDEILRSSGWQDATPQQQTPSGGGGEQVPPPQAPAPGAGRQVGMQQGMQTPQLEGVPA